MIRGITACIRQGSAWTPLQAEACVLSNTALSSGLGPLIHSSPASTASCSHPPQPPSCSSGPLGLSASQAYSSFGGPVDHARPAVQQWYGSTPGGLHPQSAVLPSPGWMLHTSTSAPPPRSFSSKAGTGKGAVAAWGGSTPGALRPQSVVLPSAVGLSHSSLPTECSVPLSLSHSYVSAGGCVSLSLSRSFAAKGGAGKEAAAEGGKRTKRRSQTRMFSVRNDRFRSSFEQVWPTLRLTDAELMMFKTNSRMFVVEMGKSISLQGKFNMNKKGSVGHSTIPSLLHEQDIHLDGVGEHPRYLRIRRLRSQHGVQLQALRKVRVLMGFKRRKYLQKMYENSLVQPGPNRAWKLLSAMESKMHVNAMRMGFAEDVRVADDMIRRGSLHVNGCPAQMRNVGFVQPGDVIAPPPENVRKVQNYMSRKMAPLMRNVYEEFM